MSWVEELKIIADKINQHAKKEYEKITPRQLNNFFTIDQIKTIKKALNL